MKSFKTGPGLFDYLQDGNIISYDPANPKNIYKDLRNLITLMSLERIKNSLIITPKQLEHVTNIEKLLKSEDPVIQDMGMDLYNEYISDNPNLL
jgi:hypothetical protein